MDLLLSLLLWVVIGGLAGWAASALMGMRGSVGTYILLGIVGGVLGGFLFALLGLPTGTFLWGLLAAIVGAVIVIAIVRAVSGPRRARTTV